MKGGIVPLFISLRRANQSNLKNLNILQLITVEHEVSPVAAGNDL